MTHRTARTRHVRPCPPSGYRTGAAALLLLSLGGCGYNESRTAHKGQIAVIGMNSEDLQACAGIPDKRQKINDHVEIFQYTRTINTPSSNDSTLFPLQTLVNLSQTTLGGAGKTCVASIRLVDDHVTDMHYSGDDDRMVGTDGVCATVVKGCLNTPVKSAHKIGGGTLGIFNPVSAFYAPTLPSVTPQPQTPPTLAHAAPITTDSTLAAPTPFGQTDDSPAAPEAIRNETAQAAPALRNGPVVNTTAQGSTPPAAVQAVAVQPADLAPPPVQATPPAVALSGLPPATKNVPPQDGNAGTILPENSPTAAPSGIVRQASAQKTDPVAAVLAPTSGNTAQTQPAAPSNGATTCQDSAIGTGHPNEVMGSALEAALAPTGSSPKKADVPCVR